MATDTDATPVTSLAVPHNPGAGQPWAQPVASSGSVSVVAGGMVSRTTDTLLLGRLAAVQVRKTAVTTYR
jgi:hypothetical protein